MRCKGNVWPPCILPNFPPIFSTLLEFFVKLLKSHPHKLGKSSNPASATQDDKKKLLTQDEQKRVVNAVGEPKPRNSLKKVVDRKSSLGPPCFYGSLVAFLHYQRMRNVYPYAVMALPT